MQPFVELLSLVPRRENMKILDLGCGQGENTKYLLDYFPMWFVFFLKTCSIVLNKPICSFDLFSFSSKVLGIDNSESMLQKAKTLVTPENASRLRFEKRSIEEISTIGGTF
jgi:trans-aconitate methyltransferase